MICSKCGEENRDNALFCKFCGEYLSKKGGIKTAIKNGDAIGSMDAYLVELDNVCEHLYKEFENVKKLCNPSGDEMITLRNKIAQLEKENKLLKEQTITQQKRIEELKCLAQNGVICPTCQKQYASKVMFCSECGTKLG